MNETLPMFTELVVIIGVSLLVLFVFRRLSLPPIAGFVLTGILIGPSVLGWVSEEHVNNAAQIGVVLLLFSVGLEISLSRLLKTSWRVYALAAGQIVGTIACGAVAVRLLGMSLESSIVVGFVITTSSSAIVLKGLSDRGELETPLGRMVVTICMAQDFAVVPMLTVIGLLSGTGTGSWGMGMMVLQVVALGGVLYLAARYVLPWVIHRLMAINTSEVVLLFTVLIMLGTAWLTSLAGLSLAIGAFAAGVILSETEYYPQIYAEVAPFRSLFSSIFFVSVGMMLDLRFVAAHPLPVLGVAIGVIVLKTLMVVVVALPLRLSPRTSLQGGLYLAQIGEFAFLLIGVATVGSLMSTSVFQYLIVATGLTMAVTPLIMQWAPRFVWRSGSTLQDLTELKSKETAEAGQTRPKPAVLIVGYGVNGHNVARVLRESGIYYEILETNPEIVRLGRVDGEVIHYGEVTRTEVLRQIEIEAFDSVVLAISDPAASRRAVQLVRQLNPGTHLIVRTRTVAEVEELEKAGANVVVPEEFETSLRIFSDLLHHYRIPPHIIALQVEVVRGKSYSLLRSRTGIRVIDNIQELLLKRLVEAVPITEGSPSCGKKLREFHLSEDSTCLVLSVLRKGFPERPPFADLILQPDDLVVLYGGHEDLNHAVEKLTSR
jgi:monovalent cation:H+ antiporter-2, CPA2 family